MSASRSTAMMAFKNEPDVSEWVPYSYHVTDHIISTPNGCLLTVFKLAGRTHECASERDLWNWYRDLNQTLKSIGKETIEFWSHTHHRFVDSYPSAEFPSAFARQFDGAYRQRFEDGPLMVNDLYLTVLYNPLGDPGQKFFSMFERTSAEDLRARQDEGISHLEEAAELLLASLKSYSIEQLGIYYRDKTGLIVETKPHVDLELEIDGVDDEEGDILDDEDFVPAPTHEVVQTPDSHMHAYSTALEWLGFLLNGEHNPVPLGRERISEYLGTTRLVSSVYGDLMQIRSENEVRYTAGVEVRDYDEGTEPGQLNLLMEADFEFVLSQSFTCMSQPAAKVFLTRQQASLIETGDSSTSQVSQMAEATDDIVSRRFIMGFHHCTVHVFGRAEKETLNYARVIRGMFNQCGMTATAIGLASEAGWYAKMPGNGRARPRPVPVNSGNFACLSSFHNFMSGKATGNPWGQSMMLFRTTIGKFGTPLFFSPHSTPLDEDSTGERPAGNTLILGKVGSGKSTLLAGLLASATKFRPRMFIYDKDRGLYPLVKALGGHYTSLQEGVPTGWQPLQLEPNRRNIAFVKRLVRMLVEISAGSPLLHFEIEQISNAVNAVMGDHSLVPHEHRTLSRVLEYLPAPSQFGIGAEDRPTVYSLLSRWCEGGDNAWLFDNEKDTLDVRSQDIYAFDLTEFIVAKEQAPPEARAPMLLYLLYRVRESIDGTRRVIQCFDEFAQYLDDPTVSKEIKRTLKTDRKKDSICIFSTQEPNDALDSEIGKSVMQAIVSLFCLYNPDATPSDYIKGLKLSEAEYERILGIQENSRQFLIKQGQQSALARMNLRGMNKEISILSGTPDNAARIARIIENVGTDDPLTWMPIYWKELGL